MSELYLLVLLEITSGVLEVRDLLKGSHPQLSLKLEELLRDKCKFFYHENSNNHVLALNFDINHVFLKYFNRWSSCHV